MIFRALDMLVRRNGPVQLPGSISGRRLSDIGTSDWALILTLEEQR